MRRIEAIERLKGVEARVRALGAASLYLFGSTARDEAKATSDLDVFLEIEPDSGFSLLDLVAVKHMIEDDLGTPADVTTREGLHPRLRDKIEREAIRVF